MEGGFLFSCNKKVTFFLLTEDKMISGKRLHTCCKKELLYNKSQREKKMTQILWEELKLEEKIIEILRVESHEPGHHFGRPFFTPYQIAIEFKIRYPEEFEKIGKPVGGKGTGQPDSVA
ncbi:hypothetical protein SDC9_91332 [bioreactor metagenome]|uniref:Uncharacterized protein n=1 Tax=bioreactor metagenome TaxID=1076179 RepID=A0A645A1D3_9ZZZZ